MKKLLYMIMMIFLIYSCTNSQLNHFSHDQIITNTEIIAEEEGIDEQDAYNLVGLAFKGRGQLNFIECVDSDGGNAYNHKGNVSLQYVYKNQTKILVRDDKCNKKGILEEYSCQNIRISKILKACVNGCDDGECI